MSLPPQKFRELVFLTLYSRDIDEDLDIPLHRAQLMKETKVSKSNILKSFQLAEEVLPLVPEFKILIDKYLILGGFKEIERVEKKYYILSSLRSIF